MAEAKRTSPLPLVTGYGLATGVGRNAAQTAALVRAAVSNFRADSNRTASIIDHRLSYAPWTTKFERFLAAPLFEAVWQAGGVQALRGRRLHSYWALPSESRRGIEQDDLKSLPERAREMLDQLGLVGELSFYPRDHVASLHALAAAQADLLNGHAEVALVIALDSQDHLPHLQWLRANDRLKCDRTASGVVVGDACAVLVIEHEAAVRRRGVRARAAIGRLALERDPSSDSPSQPTQAEAMSRALRSVLANDELHPVQDVYVDLTGERWRFLEWALTETRCLAILPHGYSVTHPADCLGDTGAAAGLVMSILAIRSYERGYARGERSLIVTSNDVGERAAALVHAMP